MRNGIDSTATSEPGGLTDGYRLGEPRIDGEVTTRIGLKVDTGSAQFECWVLGLGGLPRIESAFWI